jgi:hypothetical protein
VYSFVKHLLICLLTIVSTTKLAYALEKTSRQVNSGEIIEFRVDKLLTKSSSQLLKVKIDPEQGAAFVSLLERNPVTNKIVCIQTKLIFSGDVEHFLMPANRGDYYLSIEAINQQAIVHLTSSLLKPDSFFDYLKTSSD